MRPALVLVMLAAGCAKGVASDPDAPGVAAIDASKTEPDAPQVADAPPGTPDAATPDATVDATVTIDANPADARPLGDGDTCATANDISGISPFDFNGDLTGLANDIQPTNSCTGFDNDGPDAVFIVYANAGQTISATVTTTWDAAVEITSNCTLDATCLAGTDGIAGGGGEATSFTVTTTATYYVIVDSWSVDAYGPYQLHVTVQ